MSPQPLSSKDLCPLGDDENFSQPVATVINAVVEASKAGLRERAAAWSQKIYAKRFVIIRYSYFRMKFLFWLMLKL